MPKCDFNKVELTPRHEFYPVNLLQIFRTPFLKNTSGRLLLKLHFLQAATVNSQLKEKKQLTIINFKTFFDNLKLLFTCCRVTSYSDVFRVLSNI